MIRRRLHQPDVLLGELSGYVIEEVAKRDIRSQLGADLRRLRWKLWPK